MGRQPSHLHCKRQHPVDDLSVSNEHHRQLPFERHRCKLHRLHLCPTSASLQLVIRAFLSVARLVYPAYGTALRKATLPRNAVVAAEVVAGVEWAHHPIVGVGTLAVLTLKTVDTSVDYRSEKLGDTHAEPRILVLRHTLRDVVSLQLCRIIAMISVAPLLQTI